MEKMSGELDKHRGMLGVQWKPDLALRLRIVDQSDDQYIECADDVIIARARRGRRHIYIIFKYEHVCTCSVTGSDLVELTVLAELPVHQK